MDTEEIIAQTRLWLKNVIIAYNICPFAKPVQQQQRIHYSVIDCNDIESGLQALIDACYQLDNETKIETTLLIYPNAFNKFDDYLEFLDYANSLLADQGYEGIYQLASFHPDYCFQDAPDDDPANYTNRSPYPMLHLIREASIEKALQSYPDPEQIPQRNIKLTRKLGLKKMQELLAACYQISATKKDDR